jgi:hypothetical protein
MAVDTPFDNPRAYDAITIDGTETPGLCTFKGGGNRKNIIEDQQGLGFGGAFNYVRGQEIPYIDYELHVWTTEEYKALQALADRLCAARDARPPKVLRLTDLAVAHNKVAKVIVWDVGAFQASKIGRWFLPITLKESRPRKPIGGVPRAAPTELQKENAKLSEENAKLDKQLESEKQVQVKEGDGGVVGAIGSLLGFG